jgi:peptide/nickel transport system substrate-binding protein
MSASNGRNQGCTTRARKVCPTTPHATADRLRAGSLALLLACATACSRVASVGSWGAPHELTIARTDDPASLNALFVNDQTDMDLTQLYVEPLVGLSPKNTLIPLVASRVPTVENGDVARDGRMVTYHLRHDERFADGTQLTSADVAFTYRVIMDPRNPVGEMQAYRIIARLDTPDRYTVVLHFRRPWSAAVSELFAVTDVIYGILPAHAFKGTDIYHAAWNERPFGSGPFRVVAWKRGDEIVLEPNPYARRKPHLRRLVLKIVSDKDTELMLLRTHAVDVMDYTLNRQAAQVRSFSYPGLIRTDNNSVSYIAFNTQRSPTNDLRVRRALTEAIDRPFIARRLFRGYWPIATTEIPPVMWAHDPTIPAASYDPKRAGRELDAAGWKLRDGWRVKGGVPLEVDFAYKSGCTLCPIVQANLASIGVQVSARAYPTTVFSAVPNGVYYAGRFNLAADGWTGGSDPEQSEFFTCDRRAPNGPNAQRWCDPQYDRLFLEQSRLFDRSVRRAIFAQMQRIVSDAAIFVPLNYPGRFSAINAAVRGWKPNMLYEFSNSEDWDVTAR